MKAIILAAGLGSRLRPITDTVPKCMVPVNGCPIIDKQISNLLNSGVMLSDVYVVAGYRHEVLECHLKETYPDVNVIPNLRYGETNNMYSLYMAEDKVRGEGFLLMNGDVYFDENIIAGMLRVEDTVSLIACDRSGYIAESMKVTVENGCINHISKTITEKEFYAVSIDVYRFSPEACNFLFKEISETICDRKDENSWTEVAIDKILTNTRFVPYLISSRWVEIDNHDDLAQAESLFV